MTATNIATFDDWVDQFRQWQKDIDLDLPAEYRDYQWETKFGNLKSDEIEFGDYAGQRKWERVGQIPHQPVRDALLNLIVYQGDTEFASVEQQRNLLATAPSDYDLRSACRIMVEEMRHGWQMCALLVNFFGSTGKVEAQKLLERRSWENNRLLGSFNVDVNHWLDFYTYTEFVDRDGKFQLNMLSTSSFAPLARSMGPMLKEEAFHLGTGHMGLQRVVKKGVVPISIVQKYINKWLPTAYDLFGTDHSSSANWFYVWGLKGRYDEHARTETLEKERLNELSRELFHQESRGLIDQLNRVRPESAPELTCPDIKFHRAIGDYAGATFDTHGKELSPAEHRKHLEEALPGPEDEAILQEIFASGEEWVEKRDPKAH